MHNKDCALENKKHNIDVSTQKIRSSPGEHCKEVGILKSVEELKLSGLKIASNQAKQRLSWNIKETYCHLFSKLKPHVTNNKREKEKEVKTKNRKENSRDQKSRLWNNLSMVCGQLKKNLW